jgi:RNA polymerase sigma factor (sigma-70 family)
VSEPGDPVTAATRPLPADDTAPIDSVPGDPNSTEEQFSRFYRADITLLVRFLVRQGARAALAADLAQDAMIEAYRKWTAIEQPGAWVRSVASRGLARHIARLPEEAADPLPDGHPLVPAPQELAQWESEQELLRLLAPLPTRQRQVLAWYTDGYTITEIARELGLTEDNVRANLYKARRTITAKMTRETEER